MSDTFEEIYKPSKLAEFLCNANQKFADQTLIWYGLDELLCLDK